MAKYKEDYDSKLDFGTDLDFFDDDSPEPTDVEPFDDMFIDMDADDSLFEDELDLDDFDDENGFEDEDVEDVVFTSKLYKPANNPPVYNNLVKEFNIMYPKWKYYNEEGKPLISEFGKKAMTGVQFYDRLTYTTKGIYKKNLQKHTNLTSQEIEELVKKYNPGKYLNIPY